MGPVGDVNKGSTPWGPTFRSFPGWRGVEPPSLANIEYKIHKNLVKYTKYRYIFLRFFRDLKARDDAQVTTVYA